MRSNTSFVGHGPQRDRSKEKFWRQILRRFDASGQTVRAYCADHRLSEPSFYAWRRTLALREGPRPKVKRPRPAPPPSAAFLPVRLAQALTSRIDIGLAGGHRIRLRGPVDRAALAAVVAVLEGVPVVGPVAK